MKKILFLSLALTLSMGLWAETQTVSYRYPVYNTPNDPTSGIKEWKTDSVEATVVTNSLDKTWNAGWYVVPPYTKVRLYLSVVCSGAVHLILADGAILTIDRIPGIQVSGESNSLTIYAQSTDYIMGQLIVLSADGAGIGGGIEMDGSNITINGGTITATGAGSAAGIGGGQIGNSSNIIINGGIVTATGGKDAAGIGGGYEGDGSNITINGGTVTATGGDYSAGIGGGWHGNGSNITINGGTVTANGINGGAGIGGGAKGSCSDITINGGVVTATGAKNGAGIGGGTDGSCSDITINGGVVTATATGTTYAAGIGGGYRGSGSNIKVNTALCVRADSKNPPIKAIVNNGGDLASSLAGKQFVTVGDDPAYNAGRAAAQAILDALPTEEVPGVQLVVTKTVDGQLKQIILMNPDKVEYLKGNPPENHGLIISNQ